MIVQEAEVGKVYVGKVVRTESYGAFVEIMPGVDGLCHISQLADYRAPTVEDVARVGDEIMVMVIDIDSEGKSKNLTIDSLSMLIQNYVDFYRYAKNNHLQPFFFNSAADIKKYDKLGLLADMCRANALATVKRAGSGHLGSSFSSLDIVTFLYYSEMNTVEVGIDHPDRDIYFSSKGHDAPGHYAVLFALGIIPEEQFINLRRIGGTHGHPDVSIPGMEANSGSLGMGISKAKGMAVAKKMSGYGGRVLVMTGDGELQEGQIWESLQTTVHQNVANINVIVDFNKIQTDKLLDEIIDLGSLEKKFEIFGWHVERCDGHNFSQLEKVFEKFKHIRDKPKVLIADTVKGKGISFMEGPVALKDEGGLYKWHAGAPDDDSFEAGYKEIFERIDGRLNAFGLSPLTTELLEKKEKHKARLKDTAEKVVNAFGEALVELGAKRENIVVLDADLSADCGLRPFENAFPERFVENGIA